MPFPFFVAWKYAWPRGKSSFVHKTGLIASLGITLSTAALLIALSIFNGLEGFVHNLLRPFNPDITVALPGERKFVLPPELKSRIEHIPDVEEVIEVLQLSALMCCRDHKVVVALQGVSSNFFKNSALTPFMQYGDLSVLQEGADVCILGSGVHYRLGSPRSGRTDTVQVLYPRDVPRGSAIWRSTYKRHALTVEGVFELERQFDDHYALVPLSLVTALTHHPCWRTSLAIQLRPGAVVKTVQKALQTCVPSEFQIQSRADKQATLLKAIRIERLFVFITFGFILLIASLNTFFILAMLVLQKRKDILLFQALGTPSTTLQAVFLLEGLFMALVGTTLGSGLAAAVCCAQQKFGFLTLGTGTSLVEAYPVRMQAIDFVVGIVSVWIFTALATVVPARMVAQTGDSLKTKP